MTEHNAADPTQVSAKDRDLMIERQKELADVKAIASTPAGQRFFKRFLARGHLFHTTYTGNSRGMFNEGERNLALTVFHELGAVLPDSVMGKIMFDKKES